MRMTAEECREAARVCVEESACFPGGIAQATRWLRDCVEPYCLRLHNIYERACNEDLGELGERLTRQLESEVRCAFIDKGLGLYLNSDPRGNPVGILTPKTGRYNTAGGRGAGWRL